VRDHPGRGCGFVGIGHIPNTFKPNQNASETGKGTGYLAMIKIGQVSAFIARKTMAFQTNVRNYSTVRVFSLQGHAHEKCTDLLSIQNILRADINAVRTVASKNKKTPGRINIISYPEGALQWGLIQRVDFITDWVVQSQFSFPESFKNPMIEFLKKQSDELYSNTEEIYVISLTTTFDVGKTPEGKEVLENVNITTAGSALTVVNCKTESSSADFMGDKIILPRDTNEYQSIELIDAEGSVVITTCICRDAYKNLEFKVGDRPVRPDVLVIAASGVMGPDNWSFQGTTAVVDASDSMARRKKSGLYIIGPDDASKKNDTSDKDDLKQVFPSFISSCISFIQSFLPFQNQISKSKLVKLDGDKLHMIDIEGQTVVVAESKEIELASKLEIMQ
jgi:hypothetical protein